MTERDAAIAARFELAKSLAESAGAMALDYFNRRDTLVIETKRDLHDVVSIADQNVERFLRDRVEEAFREDGFLGEEHGYHEGNSGFTWVVDPIDGTAPFVNGMPSWCVSIAVICDGAPVIGVISAPCHQEIYAAAKGRGATLNGVRLALDPKRNLQNALTGIGSNSYVTPQRVGAIIADLLSRGGNFIRNGSGALMLAYVAAGRLVGYYEPRMRAWDCMAGFCLVTEAGGLSLPFDVDGSNLFEGQPVLASNRSCFDELREIHQTHDISQG